MRRAGNGKRLLGETGSGHCLSFELEPWQCSKCVAGNYILRGLLHDWVCRFVLASNLWKAQDAI
jgi:hypothetical protein